MFVAAGPVMGQYDPGASMDLGAGYGQIALSQSIMNGTRDVGEGHATQTADRALRLYWSNSVSREFRQKMIEELARRFKLSQAHTEKLIEDVNPIAGFQEITYKIGLDMFNVADLLTTYCVVSWEMVRNRKATPPGIASLNRKIRNSIASHEPVFASVQKLTAKEKQFWMESLAYGAMLNRRSLDTFMEQGATARAQKLREFISHTATEMGEDVKTLEL
jgi:hypothetical protein